MYQIMLDQAENNIRSWLILVRGLKVNAVKVTSCKNNQRNSKPTTCAHGSDGVMHVMGGKICWKYDCIAACIILQDLVGEPRTAHECMLSALMSDVIECT